MKIEPKCKDQKYIFALIIFVCGWEISNLWLPIDLTSLAKSNGKYNFICYNLKML